MENTYGLVPATTTANCWKLTKIDKIENCFSTFFLNKPKWLPDKHCVAHYALSSFLYRGFIPTVFFRSFARNELLLYQNRCGYYSLNNNWVVYRFNHPISLWFFKSKSEEPNAYRFTHFNFSTCKEKIESLWVFSHWNDVVEELVNFEACWF